MHEITQSLPPLVDFHCHVDLYPQPAQVVEEADRLNVKILSVTNTPSVWPQAQKLVSGTTNVRPAIGLHPQLAAERRSELDLFERYLAETRYVGEVGLDGGTEFSATWNTQLEVFQRILELCARAGGKVLTVHSRKAAKQVISLVGNLLRADKGKVILHWFSGSREEAQRAAEIGCYFSVNIRMLKSPRGRTLVSHLPVERVLTETDGPFIKRGPIPLVPKDVEAVVNELALLWETDTVSARVAVAENLQRLLA